MPSRSLVEEPGSQGTQGKASVHAAFGARSPCSSGFAFQERDPDESLEEFLHMGNSGTEAHGQETGFSLLPARVPLRNLFLLSVRRLHRGCEMVELSLPLLGLF